MREQLEEESRVLNELQGSSGWKAFLKLIDRVGGEIDEEYLLKGGNAEFVRGQRVGLAKGEELVKDRISEIKDRLENEDEEEGTA